MVSTKKFIELDLEEKFNDNNFNSSLLNIGISCSVSYLYKSFYSFTSLFSKMKKNEEINLFILSSEINMENSSDFINFLDVFPQKINLYIFFIDPLSFPMNKDNDYWTIDTFLRLYFFNKYFSFAKKILFLDIDIIVNFNVKKIWDIDLNNMIVAGVVDPQLKRWSETGTYSVSNVHSVVEQLGSNTFKWNEYFEKYLHSDWNFYINAGVFLLNVEKAIQNNIWDQFFIFLKGKQVIFLDQCLINSCTENFKKIINKSYNFFPSNLNDLSHFYFYKKHIIHYAGSPKPWDESYENVFFYWKKFLKNYKKVHKLIDKNDLQIKQLIYNDKLLVLYKKNWKRFYFRYILRLGFFWTKKILHIK